MSTKPDRAMPQQTRKMQNMVREVEKAAHVPPTAIIRLEITNKIRRPNLHQKTEIRKVRRCNIIELMMII